MRPRYHNLPDDHDEYGAGGKKTEKKEDEDDTETGKVIVELGPGANADNLITLAKKFPTATVYGIEGDTSLILLLELEIMATGLSHQVHIKNTEYDRYSGWLQNSADLVVAVAPNPGAPIAAGIANFAKPAGQVLALTELPQQRDNLIAAFGNKATVQQLQVWRSLQGSRDVIPNTSIGIPLTSNFLYSVHDPWEIYVPSW